MKKILGVVSANGLGHALRMNRLLNGLESLGYETSMICTKRQFKYLEEINSVYFAKKKKYIFTEAIGLDGPSVQIKNRFPSKKIQNSIMTFDLVLSDNVLWPLSYTNNFILCANFLWKNYWESKGSIDRNEFIKKDEFLLNKKLKHIVDYGIFSQIEAICNHHLKIPYIYESKIKFAKNDEIWISSGTIFSNKKLAETFKNYNIPLKIKFYESFMMNKLLYKPLAVIGRPGLGTISDCIANQVPFIPFVIDLDPEMLFNQNRLITLGLISEKFVPSLKYMYEPKNLLAQIEYANSVFPYNSLRLAILDSPINVAKSLLEYYLHGTI